MREWISAVGAIDGGRGPERSAETSLRAFQWSRSRLAFGLLLLAAGTAAHSQSLDGEWQGRLECSAVFPGIQSLNTGPYSYALTVTLRSGTFTGLREDRGSLEKVGGTLTGDRISIVMDGSSKTRPSWWQTTLTGTVQDGHASLEGLLTSPNGLVKVRKCTLDLASTAYTEARFRAEQDRADQERMAEERARAERAAAEARGAAEREAAERAARERADAEASMRAAAERAAREREAATRAAAQQAAMARQKSMPSAAATHTQATPAPTTPADQANAQKAQAEQAAARVQAEREAAEKAAHEKAAAEAAAAEKAAAEKAAAEKAAAEKAAAEKAAAEKAAAEKAAAESAAADKATQEKALGEKHRAAPIKARSSMDL